MPWNPFQNLSDSELVRQAEHLAPLIEELVARATQRSHKASDSEANSQNLDEANVKLEEDLTQAEEKIHALEQEVAALTTANLALKTQVTELEDQLAILS